MTLTLKRTGKPRQIDRAMKLEVILKAISIPY